MAYRGWDIDLSIGEFSESKFARLLRFGKVEHKKDLLAYKTGNHAVEFEQRCKDGIIRKSGVMHEDLDGENKWWSFEYMEDQWITLSVTKVRQLVKETVARGKDVWGGDNNAAHIAKIPLQWFISSVRGLNI